MTGKVIDFITGKAEVEFMKAGGRYFACVYDRPPHMSGGALDYYPEEREEYWREQREHIIGDFATRDEAYAAVEAEMDRRLAEWKAKRRKSK